MAISQAEQYLNLDVSQTKINLKTTTYSTNDQIKPVKIAAFYDVHLGHHRTTSDRIIDAFDPILKDEAEFSTWDILVFPGDLFDRSLQLTNPYLGKIFLFFARLLERCEKYGITILILEGTPGHDWKQSQVFKYIYDAINQHKKLNVDVHYVDTLTIEYLPKYDITFLYVPDEWHPDVEQTYQDAITQLETRGLKQVDFFLFNGAFNYQKDANLNPKAHLEDRWCDLVKYYIFAGHVHFRSQYKNILVGGSFDRLAHGEEQPKGWVTCEIKKTGEHEIIFHDNKLATIYKTIDIRGKTIEEILPLIDQEAKDLPLHSNVRLFTYNRDIINDSMKTIRLKYPLVHFTIKIDQKEKKANTLKIIQHKFETIDLNPENIQRMVAERLDQYPSLNRERILQHLSKHLR